MIEYIKDNLATILLPVIFLIIGIVLGFIVDEGKEGVYLSANYPSGENMFVFGKSSSELSDIDLQLLNGFEGELLSSKIKNLSVKSSLGQSLRKVAQNGDGPFAPIKVRIKINLITEENINGPIARACKNSPLFKNPLIAYKAKDKEGTDVLIKGILGLNIAVEHISDCDLQNGEDYEIWASKKYIKSWIKSDKFSDSIINANARMVVANITF